MLGRTTVQVAHEEDHPVVEQRQLPSDITTHLIRVVGILEDIRLLMRSTSTGGQTDQSQPGGQRDNHHAAEEEGAKPAWEVLETTSSAPSFHSCDVEPNDDAKAGYAQMACRQCRGNGLSLMQKPSASSSYAASDASGWRSGGAYVNQAGLERDILATGTKGMRVPWTPKVKMNSERCRNSTNWTKKPSSERVPRRKTARSMQPACANGPSTTGHRGWMVPEQGRQCLPSSGCPSAASVVRFFGVLR